MSLFGAIASVANGFQLVPPGQAGSGAEPAPAPPPAGPSADPGITVAPVPGPVYALSGPLRTQANEIAARQSAAAARDSYLREIGGLFSPQDGSPSLGGAYDGFARSWRDLATDPRNPTLAQATINQGDTLAGTVRSLSAGVEALATRLGGDVAAGLKELNQTLVEIHQENRAIATRSALNRPSDEDEAKRDTLVAKVVDMTGANVFPRENRGVALYTASGDALLDGRPARLVSAADGPAPAGTVVAEGRITDGRLGALLRLATDGSRASPPRPADPAPDTEVVRKLRAQLDSVAGTMLSRTRPKQPTSFSDAYDMAVPGNTSELGFGFFIGSGRHDLQVNADLLSGAKALKTDAAGPIATAFAANGRQLGTDGLPLPGASYGQLAGMVSVTWSRLGAGAARDAKIAGAANALMDGHRQTGGTVDIPGEVSGLTTVQDALGTSRRIAHALGDFLTALNQVAA